MQVGALVSCLRRAALAVALALAAGLAMPGRAEPADPAIAEALARGRVDPEVVAALGAAPRVRVVAFFGARGRTAAQDALRRLEGPGFRRARAFARVPAFAAEVGPDGLVRLLREPDLVRVGVDRRMRAQLAEAVPLARLDLVHQAGFAGAGVRVAVVDTGVDAGHPDLADAVVAEQCFCDDGAPGPGGCCPDGSAAQGGTGAGQDDHGHGTRVAGIVTSAGVHAPPGGAPDAELVVVKVLDASGSGLGSDVVAGLEWIATSRPDVDVVNVSLGGGQFSGDCDDADATNLALASAVDLLHAGGVLTVAGAGNNGFDGAMITPACLANAVSVGAVWDAAVGDQTWFGCTDATAPDLLACWSNRSATTDLLAPGALLTSSQLNGTSVTRAGTSYATPVVSACAALLREAFPAATAAELVTALGTSATWIADDPNGPFPRLDCRVAYLALGGVSVPALPGGLPTALGLAVAALGCAALARRGLRPRSSA